MRVLFDARTPERLRPGRPPARARAAAGRPGPPGSAAALPGAAAALAARPARPRFQRLQLPAAGPGGRRDRRARALARPGRRGGPARGAAHAGLRLGAARRTSRCCPPATSAGAGGRPGGRGWSPRPFDLAAELPIRAAASRRATSTVLGAGAAPHRDDEWSDGPLLRDLTPPTSPASTAGRRPSPRCRCSTPTTRCSLPGRQPRRPLDLLALGAARAAGRDHLPADARAGPARKDRRAGPGHSAGRR